MFKFSFAGVLPRILFFKNSQKNPWGGSWQNPDKKQDSDSAKNPWSKDSEKGQEDKQNAGSRPRKKSDKNFDFEKIVNDAKNFAKKILNGGGNGGGNNGRNDNSNNINPPKSIVGLVVLALVSLWLLTGFYKVNADENAAVLYFGKFYKVSTPGLNYHIPYPFGEVIKRSVTAVNTDEFGFSSGKIFNRNLDAESLMLTGDENIVDIEFQVQWQVSDIKDFVFNVVEPNQTIRKSAESVMREVIARTEIAKALSDGKKEIEQESRKLLQEVLDSYKAGVHVVLVQLRRVDPPAQVRDAFLDVQAARADKEKEINQAQSYANDVIPRARGAASVVTEEASAYNQEVVTKAQGEAERFMSVYSQYTRSKPMTRKRIYIETMEQIYRDMDKVFIDKSAARSSVVPYFPMAEINAKTKVTESK